MSAAPRQALLPLRLSVKRGAWRGAHESLSDKSYQAARRQALERDQYRCRFCGWVAEKWQETHHADDDHSNNDPSNLLTACSWCHAVHHPGFAGDHKLATLIMHPDYPRRDLPAQWRLHHWMRTMLALPDDYYDIKDQVVEFIQDCAEAAAYWLDTSEPTVMANFLMDLSDEEYAARDQWLGPVRLLPLLRPPVLDPAEVAYEAWEREKQRRQYWTDQIRRRLGSDWKRFVLPEMQGAST